MTETVARMVKAAKIVGAFDDIDFHDVEKLKIAPKEVWQLACKVAGVEMPSDETKAVIYEMLTVPEIWAVGRSLVRMARKGLQLPHQEKPQVPFDPMSRFERDPKQR